MRKAKRNNVLLKKIAARLRRIRNERNVSQLTVLIDTDIHVARIENSVTNIGISTISNLCDYYGITLKEFFDGIEKENIPDKTTK